MKTLLVASLLLLSLVASIYSQAVPDTPTQEQLQCITDASTAQALDILDDCGSADLSDFSSLCDSGACFNRLSGIYDSCNYNGLSIVCGPTPPTTTQQVPDAPTADQLQCITDASTAQALDILSDCGSANFSDISSLCNSGACFNRLSGIYDSCGYSGLNVVCGTTTTSQQVPDPPTADQLQCITDASTAQALDIVNDCTGTDLSDLSSLCNSRGACFNRVSGIYDSCGYIGLSVVCGGTTTTTSQPLPDTTSQLLPDTPTDDQLQCITDASTAQALDILNDCSNENYSDLSSLCSSGACFNRLSGIYDSCGYNGLSVVCGTTTTTTTTTTSQQFPDPPTDDQIQCITDEATAQALDIVNDCGDADLTDLSSLCNSGACFKRISGIYNRCGYNGLSVACGSNPTTVSQQFPDPPTKEQLECITDASVSQALDIFNDCGSADLSDLSSICNSGACFKRLSGIYNGCDYDALSAICGAGIGGIGGGGGGGSGAEKLIALPVLTLVAVILSMLFWIGT